MTEAQLYEAIRTAALLTGWRLFHAYDSRKSYAGFPDCVLVGHGRLLCWELKTATGRVTPEQAEWLEALERVTQPPEVSVVLPADLDWALAELQRKGNG